MDSNADSFIEVRIIRQYSNDSKMEVAERIRLETTDETGASAPRSAVVNLSVALVNILNQLNVCPLELGCIVGSFGVDDEAKSDITNRLRFAADEVLRSIEHSRTRIIGRTSPE